MTVEMFGVMPFAEPPVLLSLVPAASKLFQLQVTWRSCLAAALGFDSFFPDTGKLDRTQVALPYYQVLPGTICLTLPVGSSPVQCLSISYFCSQGMTPDCLVGEAVSAGFF